MTSTDQSISSPHSDKLELIRSAVLDGGYLSLGSRRTASPHEFYRYPARFTPAFAASPIPSASPPSLPWPSRPRAPTPSTLAQAAPSPASTAPPTPASTG